MPQKNSTRLLIAIPSAIVAILLIVGWINAQMDSTVKIEAHDTSAVAHPDMRKAIKSNGDLLQGVKKSMDSLIIIQDSFQKQIQRDMNDIKALLKGLQKQG